MSATQKSESPAATGLNAEQNTDTDIMPGLAPGRKIIVVRKREARSALERIADALERHNELTAVMNMHLANIVRLVGASK